MQLHKPEQPSITYLTLALTFSMRLKSIFQYYTSFSKSLGFVLAAFVFKDSPLSSVFAGKGFSEVADWLRVQESLKWALALGWPCRVLGWLSLANAT